MVQLFGLIKTSSCCSCVHCARVTRTKHSTQLWFVQIFYSCSRGPSSSNRTKHIVTLKSVSKSRMERQTRRNNKYSSEHILVYTTDVVTETAGTTTSGSVNLVHNPVRCVLHHLGGRSRFIFESSSVGYYIHENVGVGTGLIASLYIFVAL